MTHFQERRNDTREINKDIVVFYHGDCSDGFGGAWAAYKKFNSSAEYVPLRDHQVLPAGITGREVYFIDFVLKPEIMEEAIRQAKQLVILDHHVTAEKFVTAVPAWRFDLNKSGAMLAWEYFHPDEPVPKLLETVQAVDLWKVRNEEDKQLFSYMETIDFDFDQWTDAAQRIENPEEYKKMIEAGKLLQGYEERLSRRLAQQNAQLVEFEGYQILCVNSPIFHSLIGNILCTKQPPIAIVWRQLPTHIYVSLRGDGSVDCSKLAEKFGGGGHKNAAGFDLPLDGQLPWKIIQ